MCDLNLFLNIVLTKIWYAFIVTVSYYFQLWRSRKISSNKKIKSPWHNSFYPSTVNALLKSWIHAFPILNGMVIFLMKKNQIGFILHLVLIIYVVIIPLFTFCHPIFLLFCYPIFLLLYCVIIIISLLSCNLFFANNVLFCFLYLSLCLLIWRFGLKIPSKIKTFYIPYFD